ncbi:MAG: single-stranded-DNA-specific exonuclease RecJ, partial [Acidobacteriota bacterium]
MKWNIIEHDYDEVRRFSSLIKVEPIIGALLISRGFGSETDAERFLRPDASHLNDPFLLKDMERSVGRILRGIDGGEKILVWGDYDVDGTTGTVVLRKALDILGGISEYHVPHRFLEGYGINVEGL